MTQEHSSGTLTRGLGDHDFDLYYKILQEEKPLFIVYDRDATQTGNGYYCTMVGLGSSMEPIGEGPKDM